jgi:hypothetical protein
VFPTAERLRRLCPLPSLESGSVIGADETLLSLVCVAAMRAIRLNGVSVSFRVRRLFPHARVYGLLCRKRNTMMFFLIIVFYVVYVYTHTHTHTHTHAIYAYMCMCVCVCVSVCVCTYIYISFIDMCIYMYSYVCVCVYIYIIYLHMIF